MSKSCGLIHPQYGLGIRDYSLEYRIVAPNGQSVVTDTFLWINFEGYPDPILVDRKSVEYYPTDVNGKLIHVGDLLVCPNGDILYQGYVEKIFKGPLEGKKVYKVSIRSTKEPHYMKCLNKPQNSVVIKEPIIE